MGYKGIHFSAHRLNNSFYNNKARGEVSCLIMQRTLLIAILTIFLPVAGILVYYTESVQTAPNGESGTLEKMIVSRGTVSLELDLDRLNGERLRSKPLGTRQLNFDSERNSFFSIIVFEDELRGPIPGTMTIIPRNAAELPGKLNSSYEQLMVERSMPGEPYELTVRDNKTGFTFFNIEGHTFDYQPGKRILTVKGGRILVSEEFASEIGQPGIAGSVVGKFAFTAKMHTIEVAELVDGAITSDVLPAIDSPEAGTTPGPDVVVGDVFGLSQFGVSGSQVGLALGTTSCNYGTENLNWFRLPDNDHPVIPQNLYRMSGGSNNDARFEQIGQSSVKHAFTALTQNLCALGCNGVGGSRLGSGCSDPYSASLNAGPNLGSRAWINPFDGHYPRGDSATPPNDHSSHAHSGITHRILTNISDLDTSQNVGATYYAEGQYITPHEYAWCEANPGECNMYNNVSYRQYSVNGTGSPFGFSPVGATQREKAAIEAWPGATIVPFEPAPGTDGVGAVAYKVTSPGPGVWHYEYAVYNQNLDRAIQSFAVELGSGVSVQNVGFHSPPQHPGSPNDGTLNDAGFSSAAWSETLTSNSMTWSSESFAQNQNANAIRWGTMYNFRFDSTSPPELKNATIGFFKTGNPIVVQVMAPMGALASATMSGRVTSSNGRPLPYTWVVASGGGETFSAMSNMFGYYTIRGLQPGQTYTVSAGAKGYTFTPQDIDVNGNVSGVDVVADP